MMMPSSSATVGRQCRVGSRPRAAVLPAGTLLAGIARAAFALLPTGGLLVCGLLLPSAAQAQLNFKPLDRGDVKEVEQRMVVVRTGDGKEFGLELGGEFALRLREEKAKRLDGLDNRTQFDEDFRLKFRTWFHQDVAMHLTLQTTPSGVDDANLRGVPAEDRGSLADGKTLTLGAREAYLLWNTNPNSHLLFGKQEVSLGDRRGKVYDAIMPAAQFDCRVGTWCMPLGAIKVGQNSADWIYNWALMYRAWDGPKNNMRDALEVEVFRILYTEQNVPLGTNLGPAYLDKATPLVANPSQMTDSAGNPIYYDAAHQNYGGLRAMWLSGPLFWNFDYSSEQGNRLYHLYRDPAGGIVGSPVYAGAGSSSRNRKTINGYTWETEIGFRWLQGQAGLRYMTASGDNAKGSDKGQSYLRVLQGYHEITPGSYRGTRLYFNGGDSDVAQGGGLGHSVNNTALVGLFLDMDYPEDKKVGYQGGVYQLRKNRAVRNAEGDLRSDIGLEWDNMLIWHAHKAVQLQFEVNLLRPNGAFALNDFTAPDPDQNLLVQGIVRMVYQF